MKQSKKSKRRERLSGGDVYILANEDRSMLYTGASEALAYRLQQYQQKTQPDHFTARYDATRLVYYKHYPTLAEAKRAEKQIKALELSAKVALVEEGNPGWEDLTPGVDFI